jgi:type VI secretion system secreted protein VgrG
VVGPQDAEIFVDKYGRVKVQFFWDRQGKKDEKSSCWIRVATLWAGKTFGSVFHPRVGDEVVVDFLEGNPDRPLITGRVYNEEHLPPYDLPKQMTRSGIRTRSTKKGAAENANELRFEDRKGEEDVFFQAEKDFHREVKHDDFLKVKNDRTQTVEEGHDKLTVKKGNREVTIETGHDKLTVKKGNREVKVETGSDSTEAGQTINLKAGQTIKLTVGNCSLEISATGIKLSAGGASVNLNVAPSQVQISGGANSVTVGPATTSLS